MRTRQKEATTTIPGETSDAKLKRIREIIRDYYKPKDEKVIAPETIIERIRAVTKP